MTKGFYNLTSGMLSQSRRLDVVSNNMTNLTTPGYKAEQYTDSTFQEVLISRIGNKNKSGAQEIGEESYILAPSQLYINFAQGTPEGDGAQSGFLRSRERVFLPFRRRTAQNIPGEGALRWIRRAISPFRPWQGAGTGRTASPTDNG